MAEFGDLEGEVAEIALAEKEGLAGEIEILECLLEILVVTLLELEVEEVLDFLSFVFFWDSVGLGRCESEF